MKPLTHRPLRRGEVSIGDYIPAADQSTDAGRADFAERQRQRRLQAQPQSFTVVKLQRKP